jgi:hypothetical protein
MEQDFLRKTVRNQSVESLDNFVITKNKEQSIQFPEIRPISSRNGFFLQLQKKGKKDHQLYCLFENPRKTGFVTDCYSEIVTKVHAFPLNLVVRALLFI